MLGQPEERVEEVIGGVWEAILDPYRPRYDPARGSVKRYLLGFALNALGGRRQPVTCAEFEHDDHPAAGDDPAAEAERRDLVQHVLNRVPADVAAALVECVVRGHALEALAAKMGTSRRTLQRRVEDALQPFRAAAA